VFGQKNQLGGGVIITGVVNEQSPLAIMPLQSTIVSIDGIDVSDADVNRVKRCVDDTFLNSRKVKVAVDTKKLPLAYKWVFAREKAGKATAEASGDDLKRQLESLRQQEFELSTGSVYLEGLENATRAIAEEKKRVKQALKGM